MFGRQYRALTGWSWDDWSESESDEEYLFHERRQYKMFERIDVDKWDDFDFFARFRLEKATVAKVLYLIRPCLLFREER